MRHMSEKNGFYIKGKDGKDIFVYCFDNVSKPKAVIQIFHGLAEHAGRYKRFAQYLNNNDIIVYADDHRGHGKTNETIEEIGYIGEDGFNKIIDDEHRINMSIKEKYKGIPVIILGHSFGSFVAQEYIIRYGNEIDGVILSGSAAMMGANVLMGKMISKVQRTFLGEHKKSYLIDKLSMGNYNAKIKNLKYEHQWLSTDLEEVKKYEEDPLCGEVLTIGFYYYLFRALSIMYNKNRTINIPKKLPIYIISGEEDPVGSYGKSVKKLYKFYEDMGIENVNIKLYCEARHEILNEVNKEKVYSDIHTWVQQLL
jgi:alpha-beta hydrolase superfamily lysophospholipase